MEKVLALLVSYLRVMTPDELVTIIRELINMIPSGNVDPELATIEKLQAYSNLNNNKIMTIRLLRSMVDMGLKEAKDYVEKHCKFYVTYNTKEHINGKAYRKCPHCEYLYYVDHMNLLEFENMDINDRPYECSSCETLILNKTDSLVFKIERHY
jgi:ribosomal protein L7/L12